MRGLMICASFVLAAWQVWTFIPGRHSESTAKAAAAPAHPVAYAPSGGSAPKLMPAVATTSVKALTLKAKELASNDTQSCYQHYRELYAECAGNDQTCQMKVADRWDLCEATGFWR